MRGRLAVLALLFIPLPVLAAGAGPVTGLEFDSGHDAPGRTPTAAELATRQANSIDPPTVFITLAGPGLSVDDLAALARRTLVPPLSTLPGVAEIYSGVPGTAAPVLSLRPDPNALKALGATRKDLVATLAMAGYRAEADGLGRDDPGATVLVGPQAPDPQALIALQLHPPGAAPVPLGSVATIILGMRAPNAQGWTEMTLGLVRQRTVSDHGLAEAVRRMLGGLRGSLPPDVRIEVSAFDMMLVTESP